MNACEITRDIAQTVQQDDASKEEPEKKGERVKEQLLTYALTVRSREDFIKK